jgi:hypothetical protein
MTITARIAAAFRASLEGLTMDPTDMHPSDKAQAMLAFAILIRYGAQQMSLSFVAWNRLNALVIKRLPILRRSHDGGRCPLSADHTIVLVHVSHMQIDAMRATVISQSITITSGVVEAGTRLQKCLVCLNHAGHNRYALPVGDRESPVSQLPVNEETASPRFTDYRRYRFLFERSRNRD